MADTPETPSASEGSGPPTLQQRVEDVLRTIYDPEIPVNIYELGLIYKAEVDADGKVALVMTLTSPNCPVAQTLPDEVRQKVEGVSGVKEVAFELTWDPPWSPDRMSDAAKLQLGLV